MALKSRSYQLSSMPVTVLAHLLAIAITTLVLVWLLKFQKGFSFKYSPNNPKLFNLHPLLMIIFILAGGEAIMVYKTVPAGREVQKTLHLVLQSIALVAGILGVCAVFKFQHEDGYPKLVTLHSWLGISTISLFGLQLLLAFFSFVFPRSNSRARASYLPWHVFFGMVIFLLAICTAETGIVESFILLSLNRDEQARIVNFTGLLLFLFAACVGLTALLPRGY